MTKPKTAILWGQDDVLAQAMEIFLLNEESWDVIRIPWSEGICSLVEQVRRTRPDLVILYQGKFDDDSDPFVKLLQEKPELRVILDQPELRVITVSLENNVMQVYSKHSITVRKVSDLLSVIEDRHFSNDPIEKEVVTDKTDA
jgi:hypothetical protein